MRVGMDRINPCRLLLLGHTQRSDVLQLLYEGNPTIREQG